MNHPIHWQLLDHGRDIYNPNGTTLVGDEFSCRLDPVEDLQPGEQHHFVCWRNKDKEIVVNRTIYCNDRQLEDYIEIEDFYLGCRN